jgi:hypothetical protein
VGWLMGRFGTGRVRRLLAAGAVAAVVTTTGCAMQSPSVVAYVGNDRVTQTELNQAVDGITQTLQAGQTVATPAVVNALIHGEIAQQIADANNLTVTDAERDTFLKGSTLAPLLNVPEALPVAYAVADSQIVPAKVGTQAYLNAVKDTQVELNPRFGQLDPTNKTIIDGSTGSLSTAAPAGG